MAHQTLPWASGKRKKRPGQKKRKRKSRGGLIAVALSILTGAVLVVALITDAGVAYAVAGASTLATAAAVKAAKKQAENDRRKASAAGKPPRPAGASKPAPAAGARKPAAGKPVEGGAVKCTKTGKPTDDCPCPQRHVTSQDGAKRYGLPLGSPIVMRTKSREPKVPMTNRAKPRPDSHVVGKRP